MPLEGWGQERHEGQGQIYRKGELLQVRVKVSVCEFGQDIMQGPGGCEHKLCQLSSKSIQEESQCVIPVGLQRQSIALANDRQILPSGNTLDG